MLHRYEDCYFWYPSVKTMINYGFPKWSKLNQIEPLQIWAIYKCLLGLIILKLFCVCRLRKQIKTNQTLKLMTDFLLLILGHLRKKNKKGKIQILFEFKKLSLICFYLGESKVLQYFSNVSHNSTAPYAFGKLVKMTAHMDCLVWFYGISTIVGYLMPNPSYTAQSPGTVEYTDCTSAES